MTFVATGKEDGIQVLYKDETIPATQFLQWCTCVIHQFAVRGYIVDKKRMENGSFNNVANERSKADGTRIAAGGLGSGKVGDIGCFLKGEKTAPRKSVKDFRGVVYLSDSFSVYESVSEWFILQ